MAPGAESHALLTGVDVTQLIGNGSLYRVSPLEKSTEPLLIGSIEGKPAEPIAWTNTYSKRRRGSSTRRSDIRMTSTI